MKLDSYLSRITKINSKQIKGLKLRSDTPKRLEEKVEKIVQGLGESEDFRTAPHLLGE